MRLSVIQRKKRKMALQGYEAEELANEIPTGALFKQTVKTCLEEFWPKEWKKRALLAGAVGCALMSPVCGLKATLMEKRIVDNTMKYMLHTKDGSASKKLNCRCNGDVKKCSSVTNFKQKLISDSCLMIAYMLGGAISIGASKELFRKGKKELATPRVLESLDVLADYKEDQKLNSFEVSALANIAVLQVRAHHHLNSKILTKYVPTFIETGLSAAAISNVSSIPGTVLVPMFGLMMLAFAYTTYMSYADRELPWDLQDSLSSVLSMTEEFFLSRGEITRWNLREIQKARILLAYKHYRNLSTQNSDPKQDMTTHAILYSSEVIIYLLLLGRVDLDNLPGSMTLVRKMFKLSHKSIDVAGNMFHEIPVHVSADWNVQRLLALKDMIDKGEEAPPNGQFEFRGVGAETVFGAEIFSDLSFVLEPMQSILIHGGSGSGKSVISCLAQALVRPSSGEVLYAGKPIDCYNHSSLCRQILNCSVGSFMLNKPVIEFVSYGVPNFSRKVLAQYVKEIGVSNIFPELIGKGDYSAHITVLPKYKVAILCMLRALMSEQSIAIFDSIFDSLTPEYLAPCVKALNKLKQRCSIIVLSNIDLSSCFPFDKIIEISRESNAALPQ